MPARILAAALAVSVLLPAGLGAQPKHPLTERRIADVMGMGGADWLERPEREWEEAPEKALDALALEKGMVVADIGAGTGYFSRRIARRIAPGKVYAVDIQPEMLARLQSYAAKEQITNIETILGLPDDPRLPVAAIDLILMVDVYHEFAQPQAMLRKIREALRPSGRLVLLEYRKEDPSVPIRFEHKMTVDEARIEIEAEGFRLEKVIQKLPRQHILIFRPKERQAP